MRRLVFMMMTLPFACGGSPSERPKDENAALGGEVAARVGAQAIPLTVVASVAQAQRITAREAARHVVDDEIAASSARERGLDRRTPAAWLIVAARARWMADRFMDEARQKGPPTDDEVKILSEKHWAEVDRPPTIRVIHAIAHVKDDKDPTLWKRAKELGDKLLEATKPTTNQEDFERQAKLVIGEPKIEIKVETLPPITEDGFTLNSSPMDKRFTDGAWALTNVGDTSPVVQSDFGFHVIRLVEKIPEKRMPIEVRRLAFVEEAHAMRAHDLLDEHLKALRAKTSIAVSPAAAQLTHSVTALPEPSSKTP